MYKGLFKIALAFVFVLVLGTASLQAQVEPEAGTWATWILESADQIVVDSPPDEAATTEEIAELMAMTAELDATALEQIAYWNAGPPSYRWNQIVLDEVVKRGLPIHLAERVLALVHVGIYDSTVAAWESKYAYNRPRPSEFDASVTTVIDVPDSPSYPSEYAASAGAASAILSWLYPDDADVFQALAEESVNSRLMAGVAYPSDIEAGLELGRQVAELVIAYGETDGTNMPWDGTVPTDPEGWTGENPILPQAATWKPWVMSSPDQFRSPPPPAYGSDELEAEMEELRNIERTRYNTAAAFYWEYGSGAARNHVLWNEMAGRLILQNGWEDNAPQAAMTYAALNVASLDSLIGCWDGKYAYWAIRPFQYDPEFAPMFPTPNHPSYPAGHSCVSTAMATTLARLFPVDAERILATAAEASESRLWGGIHFRSDAIAGDELGANVANLVVDYIMASDS